MNGRVLVVDDEGNLRRMLRAVLEAEGYEVDEADGGSAALIHCDRSEPEVILLDLIMPAGPTGLEVLEELQRRHVDSVVVMMSGKATLGDAVRATQLGAFQFLEKPLTPEGVVTTVAAARQLARARAENRALRAQAGEDDEIVGASRGILEVRELMAQVAPLSTRVLISGESGTGKELVARGIHRASARRDRPMVSLNCAAVPRDLLESELFGHEKGAFTGATARRRGKFELANQSTLFLDEVGDLHLDVQAKLLRVLETGTIERLGGEHGQRVDVRVLAATNRDLERAIGDGTFREDLFYRLNVFPIRVPPLRERLGDLPALVSHFARALAARCARPPRVFSADALDRMRRYRWPGNVRELANVIERLTIMGTGGPVTDREFQMVLPRTSGPARPPAVETQAVGLTEALERHEASLITQAIAEAQGNLAEAARLLRTDRANLYRRMRRLGLRRGDTSVSD